MSVLGTHETTRKWIATAVNAGRALQSAETGFIHLSHRFYEEKQPLAIPLYENFLFALALLRTKDHENIHEAKALLDRLLHFQSQYQDVMGCFPAYIHEYPYCNDYSRSLQIAFPLQAILEGYGKILPPELRDRVTAALAAIKKSAARLGSPAMKYAWAKLLVGANSSISEIASWDELGLTLLAAQQTGNASKAEQLLQRYALFWSESLGRYIGPPELISYDKFDTTIALSDYLYAAAVGKEYDRLYATLPTALAAALLPDKPLVLPPVVSQEGELHAYSIHKDDAYAVATSVQQSPFPLYAVFAQHTCVITAPRGGATVAHEAGKIALSMHVEPVDPDEENVELCNLFINFVPEVRFLVGGKAATIFTAGDAITLSSGITVSFSHNPEIRVIGELLRKNRPTQRFRRECYDWCLSFRVPTLDRGVTLHISLTCS